MAWALAQGPEGKFEKTPSTTLTFDGTRGVPANSYVFIWSVVDNTSRVDPKIIAISKPATEMAIWRLYGYTDSIDPVSGKSVRIELAGIRTGLVAWTLYSPTITYNQTITAKSAGFVVFSGGNGFQHSAPTVRDYGKTSYSASNQVMVGDLVFAIVGSQSATLPTLSNSSGGTPTLFARGTTGGADDSNVGYHAGMLVANASNTSWNSNVANVGSGLMLLSFGMDASYSAPSAADFADLTTTESRSVFVSINSSDSSSIAASESTATTATFSSTDTAPAAITESTATTAGNNRGDQLNLNISESWFFPPIENFGNETRSIFVSESRQLIAIFSKTDSSSISISETTGVADIISKQDSATLRISESSHLRITSVTGASSSTNTAANGWSSIANGAGVKNGTLASASGSATSAQTFNARLTYSPHTIDTELRIVSVEAKFYLRHNTTLGASSLSHRATWTGGSYAPGASTGSFDTLTNGITVDLLSRGVDTWDKINSIVVDIPYTTTVGAVTSNAAFDAVEIVVVAETPQTAPILIESTDSATISISENTENLVAFSDTEEEILSISSESYIFTSIESYEDASISSTDVYSVGSRIPGEDNAGIQFAEERFLDSKLHRTDSLTIRLIESSIKGLYKNSDENIFLNISENIHILKNFSSQDESALYITEGNNLNVNINSFDAPPIFISEEFEFTNYITTSEINKLLIFENVDGFVLASASDSTSFLMLDSGEKIRVKDVYIYHQGQWRLGTMMKHQGKKWIPVEPFIRENNEWL